MNQVSQLQTIHVHNMTWHQFLAFHFKSSQIFSYDIAETKQDLSQSLYYYYFELLINVKTYIYYITFVL